MPPRFFALMSPISLAGDGLSVPGSSLEPQWHIPAGQRFVVDEFDDGIVMFDALVGATHLLNVSAADTLAIVSEFPGLDAATIHRRLLDRLDLAEEVLPLAALEELLWRLEDLNLIAAFAG
jgi:PqqD family protein of HPr-rel-A system